MSLRLSVIVDSSLLWVERRGLKSTNRRSRKCRSKRGAGQSLGLWISVRLRPLCGPEWFSFLSKGEKN